MSMYRVDTFGDEHTINYFDNEADARKFAEEEKKHVESVFLLKEIHSRIYDVVEML